MTKGPTSSRPPRVGRTNKHKGSKKTKYISPDEELALVVEQGGPGIDQELELGTGEDKLILAPMRPDEVLLQIKKGKHESYASAFTAAVKEIAVRCSPNDVGDQQPALFPNGSRRPAMPLDLRRAWLTNKPFVDNFIFIADFNNQGNILLFFKCFDLTQEGNPPPTQRISVRPAYKNKVKETQEWKIATADVPGETLELVCLVYQYATEKWNGELLPLAKWANKNWKHHQERLGISDDSIVNAATLAHSKQFYIVDIDLAVDLPGTLHAPDFTEAVKRAGHAVLASKCGLQCVKFTPRGYERTKPEVHRVVGKAYNKVSETMQQGSAKKSNTACKVAKLSSPSTAGLNAKTLDEEYNLNGITRLELTYKFGEEAWTFEEMFKLLDSSLALLTGCLVRASIHDHIAGMEPFLKASTVTYFPGVFEHAKLAFMRLKDKKKNGGAYKKNYPSGSVHRWINSHTGKMNGLEVNGNIEGREVHSSGWTSVSLAAAACCNSGETPYLFTAVAGVERLLGKTDSIQHLYFRVVPLERKPVHPKKQLQTYFVGPSKNSYEAINVFPDKLLLNPAIISALDKKSKAEIQTEISIPLDFCPEDLLPIHETCSEAVERFSGIAKGIQGANQHNMPAQLSRMSEIKIGTVGKNATEKLMFKFQGQWFWLPKDWQDSVRENVLGKTHVDCLFRWANTGFICTLTDSEPASTPEDAMSDIRPRSAKDTTIYLGKISSAADIPLSKDGHGHEIKSGGFIKKKGPQPSCFLSLRGLYERFWIAKSISDRLFAEVKAESGQNNLDPSKYSLDNYLAGCRLIKPDSLKIGVKGYPNPEQRMWIEDATGVVLVEQEETSRSQGKRSASQDVDSGSNKRPRIS
jgi:hypothetical protein